MKFLIIARLTSLAVLALVGTAQLAQAAAYDCGSGDIVVVKGKVAYEGDGVQWPIVKCELDQAFPSQGTSRYTNQLDVIYVTRKHSSVVKVEVGSIGAGDDEHLTTCKKIN